MAIKCGSTGHWHETVSEVRACQLGGTTLTALAKTSGSYGYPFRPASEKMEKWVRDILANQEVDSGAADRVRGQIDSPHGLGFDTARSFINSWKDAPRKAKPEEATADSTLPDVPAGRYALRIDGVVKFYVLDRPEEGRWAGRFFLNAQASDEKHPIRNAIVKRQILSIIAEDIQAARYLYADELGRCYRCGRTLTDELSRELRIGPDCRSK